MEIKTKYEMGEILKDIISGFTGPVIAFAYYSTGCVHYGIAPMKMNSDGKMLEWEWIDESRLLPTDRKPVEFQPLETSVSGPTQSPPQM